MEEEISLMQMQWQCIEGMIMAPGGEDGEDDELDGLQSYGSRVGMERDEEAAPRWKVLIYDQAGRDMLATLAKVSELRKLGVTLYLMLDSARQAIPDVPAVYFCSPTEKNVRKIAEDCSREIYDSFYVNFTSSIPRPVLEKFAESITSNSESASSKIKRIYDGYCNFVSLEDDLFTLDFSNCYSALNEKNVKDDEIEAHVERIVDGLFSVVATSGQVPIVRAQPGGPAELVAQQLDSRIREALATRNNVFQDASSVPRYSVPAQRLLLVLLDRSIDLPVMLHHTWSYQALSHDLLNMKLNRVMIDLKEGDAFSSGPKPFDLDKSDPFWAENAGRPFPKVAEAVENALSEYKAEVDEINRKAGSVGGVNTDEPAEGADKLAKALQSLPELTKKKQMIDLHTNVATAMLNKIKDRKLDALFHAEDQIISHMKIENETILKLLKDSEVTADDKMRLFIIYVLCGGTTAEIDSFQDTLRKAGCDLRAVKHVKEIKAFTDKLDLSSTFQSLKPSEASSVPDIGLSSMMSSIVEHGQRGLTQVANNFQQLILDEDKALESARVLETIMDGKGGREEVIDSFAYFDARQPKKSVSRTRKPFQQAVVFMVGGGNYVEYQNIKDHLKGGKRVLYGCTDLVNGDSFLRQLETLSGEKPPATEGSLT